MIGWIRFIEELLPESEFWRRAAETAVGRTISVVVVALLGVISYVAWNPISYATGYAFSVLGMGVVVPLWLLLILTVSVVAWISFSIYKSTRKRKPTDEKEPYEKEFTEATIEGIRWQWSWDDGEPMNFKPLCPDCGMEVDLDDGKVVSDSGIGTEKRSEASCPNCGGLNEWGRGRYGVVGVAKREVERRVREEEWQS